MLQNSFDDNAPLVHVTGLEPSGNTPLPEPMLIQIYVTIWHHTRPGSINSLWSSDAI